MCRCPDRQVKPRCQPDPQTPERTHDLRQHRSPIYRRGPADHNDKAIRVLVHATAKLCFDKECIQ
jgi:hypothetical protein